MISVFPELDPLLFDIKPGGVQPVLNPLAQKQIQMALGTISRVVIVKWCILTGDALRSGNPASELKVVIGINDHDLKNAQSGFLIKTMRNILGKLNDSDSRVQGTQHPISYIITSKSFKDIKLRDAYALLDDRWLKSSYIAPVVEKVQVKRPLSRRQYMKNIFRGLDRKNSDYIPDIYKTTNIEISHAKIPFEAAKRSKSGMWRISKYQALELAKHFHLTHLPKRRKPFKMLGNTGIMIFRPHKNKLFLVKGPYAHKVKKAFRNVVYA